MNDTGCVETNAGTARIRCVSDVVVGQIQRYMGYVKEELAEKDQTVKGVIIGFEDDLKIRRALSVTSNIDFYTYKISFKLEKQ